MDMNKAGITMPLLAATISVALYFSGIYPERFHEKSPIVNTPGSGSYQGLVMFSRQSREYYSYRGIRYAQPPVGSLRFKPPQELKNNQDLVQAFWYGSPCIQFDAMGTASIRGSEDCLFLNIFVPKAAKKPLSVLVWIHGGAFISGESNTYDPRYLMDEDVVVVTMNYRLGIMGFFNLGDENAAGNMGLKDQNMAMKWVKNNILYFGGDPTRITLIGESAGGASVNYHMISESSRGLFSKAISLSGTRRCSWAVPMKNPKGMAREYASSFNCPTDSSLRIVQCLSKIAPEKLVAPAAQFRDPCANRSSYHFGPSIETYLGKDSRNFLTKDTLNLASKKSIAPVPWLLGTTTGEGGLKTSRIEANHSMLSSLSEKWLQYTPNIFEQGIKPTDENLKKVYNMYFNHEKQTQENTPEFLKNMTALIGDFTFNYPVRVDALEHSAVAPTYLYTYTYLASSPSVYSAFRGISSKSLFSPEIQAAASAIKDYYRKFTGSSFGPHNYGPCHADDVIQMWRYSPILTIAPWHPDFSFSKSFISMLVDFSNTRIIKRNNSTEFINTDWTYKGVTWPNMYDNSIKSPLYMKLDDQLVPEVVSESPEFVRKMNFWHAMFQQSYPNK